MMNGNTGGGSSGSSSNYTYSTAAFATATHHPSFGDLFAAAAAAPPNLGTSSSSSHRASHPSQRGRYNISPQPPPQQQEPLHLGPSSYQYNPAASNNNSNNNSGQASQQQQQHNQQQHHQLFLASMTAAASYAAQQQQQQSDLAVATAYLNQAAASAAVAAAHQQQQQSSFDHSIASNNNSNSNSHPFHHHHLRQDSFDQMLLMHPSLLAPFDAFPLPTNNSNKQQSSTGHHHPLHVTAVAAAATTDLPPAVSSTNRHHHSLLLRQSPGGNRHNDNLNNNPLNTPTPQFMSRLISNEVLQEPWLMEIHLPVPSISLEPLTGDAILRRIALKLEDVLTKYIPCVDFLVQCQQDLRRGLEDATTTTLYRRGRRKTPREFFVQHVHPLPEQFLAKNRYKMDAEALQNAYEGLQQLRREAERTSLTSNNSSHRTNSTANTALCETVKSTFLGGMKDGESWGLRKWLSQHGDALAVCTDLECILGACQQKLDKNLATTKQLSDRLRPMAHHVLQRLKAEIPTSYQQHSTAHPYLPFFHRLEAALRSMSHFDPTHDGVICIDDDDTDHEDDSDDEVREVAVVVQDKVKAATAIQARSNNKRKRPPVVLAADDDDDVKIQNRSVLKMARNNKARVEDDDDDDDESSSGVSEAQSIVEIIDFKTSLNNNNSVDDDDDVMLRHDWKCTNCEMINAADSATCLRCGEENTMTMNDFIPGLEFFFNNSSCNSRSRTPNSSGASIDSGYFWQVEAASPPPPAKKGSMKKKKLPPQKQQQKAQLSLWPLPMGQPEAQTAQARAIADNLEQLASIFENEQQGAVRPMHAPYMSFWEGPRYALALRLIADLLRQPEAPHVLDTVDDISLVGTSLPPYSHVIRHPLGLRDVCTAVLGEQLVVSAGNEGTLPRSADLPKWNMWKGTDLLMAVDLVLVNALAYGKVALEPASSTTKPPFRGWINGARKLLWDGITEIVQPHSCSPETKRLNMPVRRSEKSGFVVHKIAAAASLHEQH